MPGWNIQSNPTRTGNICSAMFLKLLAHKLKSPYIGQQAQHITQKLFTKQRMELAKTELSIAKQKIFFHHREMSRHSRKFKNLGEQIAPENLKQFLEYTSTSSLKNNGLKIISEEFIQALEKEPDAIRPLERLISYSPDSPIIISSDDDDSLRQMDIRGFMLPTSTPMKSWETLPNLTLTPINPEIKRDESTVQIRNRLDFDGRSFPDIHFLKYPSEFNYRLG